MWPEGIDGRAIANGILDDVKDGVGLQERLKRYDDDKTSGAKDRLLIWAGTGVGLVNNIEPTSVSCLAPSRTFSIDTLLFRTCSICFTT
jgi:nitronate monooxygenase